MARSARPLPRRPWVGFTLTELVVSLVVAGMLGAVAVLSYESLQGRAEDRVAEAALSDIARKGRAVATWRSLGGFAFQHDDFDPETEPYTLLPPGEVSEEHGEVSAAVDGGDGDRAGLAMRSRSGRCSRVLVDGEAVTTSTNSLGAGEECSGEATLLVGVAPPAPVLTGTAGVGSASVSWDAVDHPHVTRYVVERNDEEENYSHTPGSGYTHTDTELPAGVAVVYTVRAENPYGHSSASVTVTPVGPPGAPVLQGTAGAESVELSWSEPSGNGGGVDGYRLESRVGEGGWALLSSPGAGSTSATVGGLVNGTVYEIRIRGWNEHGDGAWSEPVTLTPSTVPGAPVGMEANPGAGEAFGTVTVSWTGVESEGGSPVSSYELQQSSSAAFPGAGTVNATSPRALTGLAGNTTYWVRVRAVNSKGPGAWATVSVLTAPAGTGTPTLVAGTGSSYDTVTVSWSAPAGGAGGYQVQYATNSGFVNATTLTSATSPRALTGLAGNTTYWVRVRATNATGSGAWSPGASVLTAPGAVSGLTMSCPEGYNASGVLVNANTTNCTVSVSASPGTTVSGTVTGPAGYSASFTGTSYSAGSVPLAELFVDPVSANARQCNATGCGPWYGNVAKASVPQPGVPTVTNLGCAFGHCQVRFSATKAWTYEVNLWGGPASGVVRCLGVGCADGSGSWPIGGDAASGYWSQRNNVTDLTRAFHVLDPCTGQGGCVREVIIPQGAWIRVAGTNGYRSGAVGWPASGWCLPQGAGVEPILSTCNWTQGPGTAEWRSGYFYIG